MRVTTKGQVTIPKHVREALGIVPETEIEFVEDSGRFYITRAESSKSIKGDKRKFSRFRGITTAGMTTNDIMKLTRDES